MQEVFDAGILRVHFDSSALGIERKVVRRGASAFYGDHFRELLRQWQREQSRSGVEIHGGPSRASADGGFHQIVDQEAIHLKKRLRTHAERADAGFVVHGDSGFHPVVETPGDGPLGIDGIDLDFRLVGEDFHRFDETRETRIAQLLAQGRQSLIQPRGCGRALALNGSQCVGGGLQETYLAALDVKLGTVAISIRRTAYHTDLTFELNLADSLQLLPQDFDFARELKLIRRMLVVASATSCEQRARWCNTFGRWADHRFERRMSLVNPAYFHGLAGQHERDHHYSGHGPGQAVAPVDPLFDTDFVYDKSSPKTNMKKRVLSGIQPTGSPHIGNYLGALKNWAKIQYDYDSIYCIVDLHAITIYQDPAELRGKILELAGMLLALGIDPKHSSLVVQSSVPEHAELAWMLTCVTPVGWLERMTQYKAKTEAQESISDGLLQYPVLMAADILLYQAHVVPVGDDQTQHLELARDIAQRFNSLYGETFTMPETRLPTVGARIMGLDDPEKKMSKSTTGEGHAISLLDPPDRIRKKLMRATTDSNPAVDFDTMGPGVRNLLAIYQAFTEASDDTVRNEFSGLRYGDLKKRVAEAVVGALEPMQQRYREITADPGYVAKVLADGAVRVLPAARDTVQKVKRSMGLYTV